MEFKVLGKPINRYDAVAKVTGKAKYAGDFKEADMLVGKVLRSTIAHGIVKKIDTSKAKALPGVEAVITFEDVPDTKFPTAGHPHSLEKSHQDIPDRNILTKHVRYYGDEIAAVVAVDNIVATRALDLIEVEYEELPVILTVEDAKAEGAPEIHEGVKNNLVAQKHWEFGDVEAGFAEADYVIEDEFETQVVQHCQMEPQVSYAYIDPYDRLTIVSSTQIPHVCRRVLNQAFGISFGKIRVIKPFIGGGFGVKQDVVNEPINAAMTMAVGGRPVRLEYGREESMSTTRVRHGVKYKIKTGVNKDGEMIARHLSVVTAKGAYASHGLSPIAKQGTVFLQTYPAKAVKFDAESYYSNTPAAGAMRAYGIPQIGYSMESHMDNIAKKIGMDPIELRRKNLLKLGDRDPLTKLEIESCGIRECMDRGKTLIRWDEKIEKYKNQSGLKRRGVGMAAFTYGSGTYPVGLEVAGCRITMRQDGTIQMGVGATEIGQGADTVFSQMAAEILTLTPDQVYLESTTDTDTSPFDTGAYASRQTYVSGGAVKKAALEIKEKLLLSASTRRNILKTELDLADGYVVYKDTGAKVISIPDLAMESYYDRETSAPITADVYHQTKSNALSMGVTFVEVEVDMQTGKIEIIEIYNVHDAGRIMNHQLAEGQVHGGMSMGLGYALTEEMKFHEKTGKPLNNNLLDYKLPTMMDTPDFGVEFVETYDPTGPFGNKSLGEPPAISQAPAIRNAVLNATGIAFNCIPMNPQRVFEKLSEEGKLG